MPIGNISKRLVSGDEDKPIRAARVAENVAVTQKAI
jgi:hypothetical protein